MNVTRSSYNDINLIMNDQTKIYKYAQPITNPQNLTNTSSQPVPPRFTFKSFPLTPHHPIIPNIFRFALYFLYRVENKYPGQGYQTTFRIFPQFV